MRQWWRDDPLGLKAIPSAVLFVLESLWRTLNREDRP